MPTLRTAKTEKIYAEHKKNGGLSNGCPLCLESAIKEFKYWRIIDNKFPYDKIAEVHHMITPKRHVAEGSLDEEEKEELYKIKTTYVAKNYDFIIEASPRLKTIPAHFHLHLIVQKG